MDYKEILSKISDILGEELDRYLSGDKEPYMYKLMRDEQFGDVDEHQVSRKRLVYALQFGLREIGEPLREQIVRELFEQEVISREKNSFQGIGSSMEMLTDMIQPYRRPEDNALLERAKDANFDCFCGLMKDGGYGYPKDIYEYNLEAGIYMAGEMQLREQVCALVDIFKAGRLDTSGYEKLRHFAEFTQRPDDRETAVLGYYDCVFKSPASGKIMEMRGLTAAKHMILLLCDMNDAANAEELLYKHTDVLLSANGRAFYECAIKIMQTDSSRKKKIWRYVKKNSKLKAKDGTFYPICYTDYKKCAELAGDKIAVLAISALEKKEQ
ncbi:hypothetical protein [Ruminococcus sp.]|uniref:hypothetical protein n=1 Tax=Ruminococcus sp. TaxID=41978 RepID=UPI0025D9618D|nr:hypothetical protein [Ruminococcus sp.]MBQ8967698.1 hypothetical protein [Ruminococcus sp.]